MLAAACVALLLLSLLQGFTQQAGVLIRTHLHTRSCHECSVPCGDLGAVITPCALGTVLLFGVGLQGQLLAPCSCVGGQERVLQCRVQLLELLEHTFNRMLSRRVKVHCTGIFWCYIMKQTCSHLAIYGLVDPTWCVSICVIRC